MAVEPGTTASAHGRKLLPSIAAGSCIAAGVVADAQWLRGVSLRWAAPWLWGWTPPLVALLTAALLALALVVIAALRRCRPDPDCWPILLLFSATQLVGFSIANIEPVKITLLVLLAHWLAGALGNDRTVRLYRPHLLLWLPILMFSLASVVNGRVVSLVAQYSIAAKLLMFFFVANIVRTPKQLRFTVRLIVALGMSSAVIALLQEAIFYFLKLPLTLDVNAPKDWFKQTPLGWMIRATAFHPTAQNLNDFLLMALAMLLAGPFTVARRVGGTLLLGAGVFFTFTGNGLVVMVFLMLLAPIVRRPRLALHYLTTLMLIVLSAYQSGLLGWIYGKYLLPLSVKSAEDRIELLQMALEVIGRHPWVGMGLNNVGRVSPQPVHNAYLQMVTEIGVVAGCLLVLILLLVGVRLAIGVRWSRGTAERDSGKAVLLAFLSLTLHFSFEPFINSLVSWSLIGLAEATALILASPVRSDRGFRPSPHAAASTP